MMRHGKKTQNGYWRPPTVGGVFSPDVDETDTFASVVDLPALAEANSAVGKPASANEITNPPALPTELAPAELLPRKLERVTVLSLEKAEQVLRIPTDPRDGNLLRAQVTTALGVINSQLRADETRLRAKVQGDVLERLLKAIEREKVNLEKLDGDGAVIGRGEELLGQVVLKSSE
jgi:hypothetical protein